MNNLKELLDSFSGLSLAVIGDICLDLYYFLSNEKSEISVETGLQTQSVSRCKHEAGGAANVAVNLKALGAGVTDLYGVVGDDFYGGILRQLLEPRGVQLFRNHKSRIMTGIPMYTIRFTAKAGRNPGMIWEISTV
jgi:bifunctional ADP-heptose synthase (sugar kinase/adenylyltransferase)